MTEYWKMRCPVCGVVDSKIPKDTPPPGAVMHMTCHEIGSIITDEPQRVEYATEKTREEPLSNEQYFEPIRAREEPKEPVDNPREVLPKRSRTK
jgi:hypothetical protein